METIVIAFAIKETNLENEEYAVEFYRQLKLQEKGLKELTVREYLENRQNYSKVENSEDKTKEQKRKHEKARCVQIEKLVNFIPVLAIEDKIAKDTELDKWICTQVAFLIPDQATSWTISNGIFPLIYYPLANIQATMNATGTSTDDEQAEPYYEQAWAQKLEETVQHRIKVQELMFVSLFKEEGFRGDDRDNAVRYAMKEWEKGAGLNVGLDPMLIEVLNRSPPDQNVD